jgi:GDP-L-fucose synthase
MDKNAKIFVAGHRGLVGSALVRVLRTRGYTNLVTRTRQELDLRDQAAVNAFFEAERPQYVFLSAAKVGGIIANNTFKADFIAENLAIAQNVIQAACRTQVVKLLNFGSSCIYPRMAPQPIREDALLTGPLEPTNEPYAIAKIAAIKLCRYFNEQYGTNFISTMPTNLYGPNDNFNLQTSHVLPALIRKFVLASFMQNGEDDKLIDNVQRYPLGFGLDETLDKSDLKAIRNALQKLGISVDEVVLWGTGTPYREFLHVDDLAEACLFLMERYNYEDIGELINIGTGQDLTIKELAEMVCQATGFHGRIRFDPSKPDGTPRKLLDIRKITSLGWRARIQLQEGIKSIIAAQSAPESRLS